MFTLEELRKIDVKKLKDEIAKTEKDLFKTRFQIQTGQTKSSHSIKMHKKYLAQMKTIMTESNNS